MPEMTRDEVTVLRILCRPILEGDMLTSPAGIDDIAAQTGRSAAKIDAQLRRLVEAFEVTDPGANFGRLAAEAVLRGGLTLYDED